ncbi:hypothetical protein E4634_03690 [Mangrovimicrobium sediminis]|uniref:Uncharacterized protein n=1 Tax=Mangrovimicrobium sediminis TaxID=2562682 RepID=A0A4Z0M624_9GAMM|nr:hypothetical protein [Haliea sp. SAOS-164]TGD75122.1 hypothetical protein E4634_03690 [Haliea sp. SAOS-164]
MSAVNGAAPTQQVYADALRERMELERPTIAALRSTLVGEMQRFGFDDLAEALGERLVNPELRKDSFDGSVSLFAEWRTPSGALLGYLLIHGGGQVYAEFDVLRPHPSRAQWVIEAMTAWGQADNIKAEPRLLPALGD